MKAIFYLFLIFTTICNSQELKETRRFYKITIFQWTKDSLGIDNKRLVVIDENGDVTYNKQKNYAKFDVAILESFFSQFIQKENIIKNVANDDPPSVASIPNNGEKNIYISIIETKDFIVEKDYVNPSQYNWRAINFADLTNIFHDLHQTEMITLKKMLE